MQSPEPLKLEQYSCTPISCTRAAHRRDLLVQNGLLAVERVRDPLLADAIVVSIGERARVMARTEFRSWLDDVRQAFDAC